jgi:DNA repair exonuclease SbcCD ATPase subunit
LRITRLYLRNYRVFGDELDLPIPGGLVGIYGVNGAGKSALVESIRWSLFGKARTGKDEVRTDDVKDDCVTEVEFEHEGHLYLVRRVLTGINSTQKAEAHWNGAQVAEGVTDVRRYVESVLGMDDASFRASVFAEQKQVSAFSEVATEKRRELVLRLLGITPLDKARDLARSEARDHKKLHESLQQRLPDLEALGAKLAEAEDAATALGAQVEMVVQAAAEAGAARDAADLAFEMADDLRRRHETIMADGLAVKTKLDAATTQQAKLRREQELLAAAAAEVGKLRPIADGLPAKEARLAQLRGVDAAQRVRASLPAPAKGVVEPDEGALDAARAAAEAALAAASAVIGELRAATAEVTRAEESAARSADLSPDQDCPVCGQSLGDAFEQVVAHREGELAAARKRVAALEKQRAATTKAQATAKQAVDDALAALKKQQAAWSAAQEAMTRRAAAEEALAAALADLATKPKQGELEALTADVDAGKQAAGALQRLEGQLLRAKTVDVELAAVDEQLAAATAEREALLTKLKAVGFDKDALDAARVARDATRKQAMTLEQQANDVKLAAAKANGAVETAKEKLSEGEQAHAELQVLVDEVRHTTRTAELLSEFRNTVVQAIGPQLAAQAADLFAELTDHEYETLDVDPTTFDIKISDAGVAHGLARFSGSETDLANLALRVAISEHVRFQSGGAVGLLVLDEVFGPLDPDRKDRMLQALNRLGGRFRQVLVITHDESIKEQLPSAIEVVKLPGRRATARVLTGI